MALGVLKQRLGPDHLGLSDDDSQRGGVGRSCLEVPLRTPLLVWRLTFASMIIIWINRPRKENPNRTKKTEDNIIRHLAIQKYRRKCTREFPPAHCPYLLAVVKQQGNCRTRPYGSRIAHNSTTATQCRDREPRKSSGCCRRSVCGSYASSTRKEGN